MDPIKLITYVAAIGVATLIVMGGVGFYAGYSAGRADLSEMKDFLASSTFSVKGETSDRPVTAALDFKNNDEFAPILSEIRGLGGQMRAIEKLVETKTVDLAPVISEIRAMGSQPGKHERPLASAAVDLGPILSEIKSVNEQMRKLERIAVQQTAATGQDDGKLREELGRLKQIVAAAGEQLNACQVRVAALETAAPKTTREPQTQTVVNTNPPAGLQNGTVVLYDSFYLKKDQNKAFEDVNLTVALQGVASRSARIDINKQTVSIAFGERKEIVYNNMVCELNLMETDLSASRARFNIACKK